MPGDLGSQINDALSSSIFGIPVYLLVALAAIVFIVLYFMRHRKPSDDIKAPKIIEPEDELKKEFKDLLKTTGSGVKYKSYLMFGMLAIGRILSWTPYRYEELIPLKEQNKANKPEARVAAAIRAKSKDYQFLEDNFYLYKVIGRTIFSFIWYIFGNLFNLANERFFLIDKDYIKNTESRDQFIKPGAQPFRFYDKIYIMSEPGSKVIQLFAEHINVKQMIKSDTNRIPLIQYHDLKTAKFAARAEALRKVKKKAWADRNENLEKDYSAAEDEED